jgi:hypothetical protein
VGRAVIVAECRWCPFTVPLGEPKLESEPTSDGWTMRITRPFWELYMAEHIVTDHPDEAAQISSDLVSDVRREAEQTMNRVLRSAFTTARG